MAGTQEDVVLNLQEIRANIKEAMAKSPHAAKEVKLVTVTKTFDVEHIRYAVEAGSQDLAENRVQELLEKHDFLPKDINWHLIGHLQTNKVKYLIDKVAMIHSLDSLDLAAEIEKRAAVRDRVIPCLVQVNIGEDDNKFGITEAETLDFCKAMAAYPHIQIRGLMTIGPFVSPEEMRPIFAALRILKEKVAEEAKKLGLNHLIMQELSMGMSNDYDVAVEEGATIVRVGSKIFGARVYR